MIFAVIGIDYKSKLLFIEATIDADRYVRNLVDLYFIENLDEKHGVLSWIFQRYDASSHTAEATIDCVEKNCNLLARWPTNSPDLNPIEPLWVILKNIVSKLKSGNIDELMQVLLEFNSTINHRSAV
jgi:transposase